MDLQITRKQQAFINAKSDEVLFGGAAGPGKSYGQLIDGIVCALKYPKSKQLILRRTFPELEKSLIRTSFELYPQEIYKYDSTKHTGTFKNGSLIDFAYCDKENDVYRYQSAEYDFIRFDELTHFTETMYTYLISRVRGANPYPKQIKSSSNPGGVGHSWVKARFIDIGPAGQMHQTPKGSRLFIPALLDDNPFLMESDPGYLIRLENLDEKNKKALRYGDWDIFEGQYFSEWDRNTHVVKPFEIPAHWRRYITLDYGLDMLACYWIATDYQGNAYVYKELYETGLIVSKAAEKINALTNESIYARMAPPDLWNRHSDSGESTADIFTRHGVPLTMAKNDRVQGWLNLHEWLNPFENERGEKVAKLRIFENCVNLIRTLPMLQFDAKNPNDCATEPHDITHAPDAIRYFIAGRPMATEPHNPDGNYNPYGDFLSYGT